MRALRLSLVGTVILVLLGGAVLAQHEPAVASGPEYEWVTSVSSVCSDPDQPVNGKEGGLLQLVGHAAAAAGATSLDHAFVCSGADAGHG